MADFYKVGGCVRDEILEVRSKDIDYSVEAESFDDMRQAIINRGGEIFLETPQYFTIRANVPNMGACDFVLCRKDGEYVDGRRPESVSVGNLMDDLARRDFTMNAIAKNEAGHYIDPFGGMGDIGRKVIRCVGNPMERFQEDYLRILRALRFSITKNMVISPETGIAAMRCAGGVSEIATERIREELLKMFKCNSIQTIELLQNYGLLYILAEKGIWLMPTTKG